MIGTIIKKGSGLKRARTLNPDEEEKIRKQAEDRIQADIDREERLNRRDYIHEVTERIGKHVDRKRSGNVITMKVKYIEKKTSALFNILDHNHLRSIYSLITNDRLICFPERFVFFPETLFRVFLAHASTACFMDKNGRSRRTIPEIAKLTGLSESTVKQKESELRKKKIFYRLEDKLTVIGDEVWFIQSQPMVTHEENIIAYHIEHLYKFLRREIKHSTAKVWGFITAIDGGLDEAIREEREYAEEALREIGDRLNLSWRTVLKEAISYELPPC